jgi:hypothetical protein
MLSMVCVALLFVSLNLRVNNFTRPKLFLGAGVKQSISLFSFLLFNILVVGSTVKL